MKRIFLFARDPGGANVISPVYEECKNRFETFVYAKDFALQRLKIEGIPVVDIRQKCSINEEQIYNFLKNINPDVVVTGTSLDDYVERYLWRASERLCIKSYAILDQWMNLGMRFSKYSYAQKDMYEKYREHFYLPYRVLVMDELAKKILIDEGIEEERIVVTGQPHFETIRSKYRHVSAAYDKKYWNIVYASEPILREYDGNDQEKLYWGYNEKIIFQHLYDCLARQAVFLKNIRLIIRPHPREDIDNWKEIINSSDFGNIKIELDVKNSSFAVLKSADIVCGMSSMFLLEAVICEKEILSIQIGLCQENPFVLEKLGLCYSVLTKEELFFKLTELFEKLQKTEQKETPKFPFVKNAVKNILSIIEEKDECIN